MNRNGLAANAICLPRVSVVQDGARLHYAVPLALAQAGMLERMFTEWFATANSAPTLVARALGWIAPATSRRLLDRSCPQIPRRRAVTHPLLAIYLRLARTWFATPERYYDWCSAQVAGWVRSTGWGRSNAVFGFVRNIHPQVCEAARREGLVVVADQMIAPSVVEQHQFRLEQTRWPGWEPDAARRDFERVDRVERRTWRAVHHLTCASEYVRQGLVNCRVPPERVTVIPYPIRANDFTPRDQSAKTRSVTVGFVGHVGLRKGAPYFLEIARRLAGRGIRFVMVGPVGISDSARADLAKYVELTGSAARSRIPVLLSEFDVFLFPSTCEGSAGAVTEAMAMGLPVVTSPNSGSLVLDEVNGIVRAYDDVDGLADAVDQLVANPALRRRLGAAARLTAEKCTLEAYGCRLIAVFMDLLTSLSGRAG